MYQDDQWQEVDGDELEGFVEQVHPIDGRHKVSSSTSKVHWRMLPWYENIAMIRVMDSGWENPDLRVYYLAREGQLYRLNGTSPPIHEVNEVAPIKVTEDNVLEYLEFFCFFVRGEEGPFLMVESMDNPYLPEGLDDARLKAIESVIRPATFEGYNSEGHFLADAVVYYSNALFLSNFAIHSTGMIEMTDDDPLLGDLPVKVDAPVS